MRAGRGIVGAVAVAIAAGGLLAFGPWSLLGGRSEGAQPRGQVVLAEPRRGEAEAGTATGMRGLSQAWPPAEVGEVSGEVPGDVTLEASPLAGGGVSVRVTREGHLVALRHRDTASAGRDWAALELRTAPGAASPGSAVLVWEATELRTLETVRGLVKVDGDAARLVPSAPPKRGASLSDPAKVHDCVSHRDGAGGFVVLCRLGREARRARAVNVTGSRPLEGAWVVDEPLGRWRVARLELPRGEALAEGRAITYVRGVEGVVVRAEVVWGAGGDGDEGVGSGSAGERRGALLLAASRRVQPVGDSGF
ncbi:hypothetical protein [Chondromyces apiculatus]|uniref:Uncharacterized protein n=1 Tax=Chondromyces apiculatus DSM 436 TaxID=1192034 RepID=A0A017T2I8_9BACT|nr:hypothetical protein [Chondromyces apiculatus]EYF02771.1 Hypothetical protein CAP_6506 [Chondromyces apiculatus DSM 436]